VQYLLKESASAREVSEIKIDVRFDDAVEDRDAAFANVSTSFVAIFQATLLRKSYGQWDSLSLRARGDSNLKLSDPWIKPRRSLPTDLLNL
jgi:hypothetical protein